MNYEWLINMTSLAIGKMQIKSTFRLYLSPIRDAKRTNSKCWLGWEQRGTCTHCCWECKLVLTRRKLMEVLHESRHRSITQPSCATLALTPRTPSHTSQMFTHQCITIHHIWLRKLKKMELFSADVCRKMNGTGHFHSKQIKLISERQISYFSHLGSVDFCVDTENHLCTYDMRRETKLSRKERVNRMGRKRGRHQTNIIKVCIILVRKCLYLSQCCVQWIWNNNFK